jgi:hypothetical protein
MATALDNLDLKRERSYVIQCTLKSTRTQTKKRRRMVADSLSFYEARQIDPILHCYHNRFVHMIGVTTTSPQIQYTSCIMHHVRGPPADIGVRSRNNT